MAERRASANLLTRDEARRITAKHRRAAGIGAEAVTRDKRLSYKSPMVDDWDDILSEIESLKQDMRRIVDAMTITTSDLDQTWEALRKTQSDFGNLNKKVATLRALSPYTKKYGRTG